MEQCPLIGLWLRRHLSIITIAAVIIIIAAVLWCATPFAKDIVIYITNTLLILSISIAFVVYLNWQRVNINRRWWLWDITFWNKEGIIPETYKLPIVIIHLIIVNADLFSIVINRITLSINDAQDENNVYRLTACGLTDEQAFKLDGVVSNEIPVFKLPTGFDPIIVKRGSEEKCWIVFISPTDEAKKLDEMLNEGVYKCKLELVVRTAPSIPLDFPLTIDSSHKEEYKEGWCRIDIRTRYDFS
jgi:hypothetical protein